MGKRLRTLTHRFRERGAAAVESLIALPIVALLMLGGAEWARIYEAKTTLDHAAVQGARYGSVDHAQPSAIQRGIAQGMLPFYAPASGDIVQTQAELTATLGTQSRLRILNPTPEAFDDFGLTENGRRVLPNTDLQTRSTAVGASSGLNIQDANLLKVETTWGVELRMPFIAQVISFVGQSNTTPGTFENYLYSNGMIPVTATTLVRMQSEAWENSLMVSIADQNTQRQQGGPEEQLVDGGSGIPWGSNSSGGYDGSLASSYVQDGTNLNRPGWASGHAQGDAGFDYDAAGGNSDTSDPDNGDPDTGDDSPDVSVPEEGPSCKTTWDDPRYEVQECDSWYCDLIGEDFAELTEQVKVALKIVGDFIEGLIDGLVDQAQDLIDLITDPSVLLDLAKAFVDDPMGTIEALVESVADDVETVMECGPYDVGLILGQNFNPAAALKIVAKLADLSGNARLAKYADDLEKDIECASFPAGTLIWTPDGPVPIEQLNVGDRVESRNTASFALAAQPIVQELNRTAAGYQRIDTEFGTLTVTPEHPFWVQGKGWTEAKELEWEDPIATLEGDVVAYGNTYVEEPTQVYNFSVANTPNYFAGEAKAWVHNANCDIPGTKPGGLAQVDNLKDRRLDEIDDPIAIGAVGEAKVNRILEQEHNMTRMGDKNLAWDEIDKPDGWQSEFDSYKGSSGIDSIYRGNDGKIYIVESKATGAKYPESCKAGSLCTSNDGQQMSQDWINDDRLAAAGLEPDEIAEVRTGLSKNDGTVVRLYGGTNAAGNTKFYEIHDQPGSTSRVKVDRAGSEYQF
ncbi:polymorphic toxin-type HINT domain-containing protein [Marinobacterium mangrovicola]|uniref:Intein n=1 Tax=Marinobacterium mangrovicola TaxID=1476959 RepID=A0A4R1GHE7_9GAMM|nr:polymorphic toxin-type HINT domain-containing protein [Marinobacterium mangrovicola]TCK03632.1 intein [Marinobacterium mangrovicola]